ncbi:MAG: efflux RND transporter periplasmic adaptor subunit [Lachnospiraceae bacterium]|nr:efflux RND transporter periplasmic adaptor subunit [Lachnospiraceae bacterium]
MKNRVLSIFLMLCLTVSSTALLGGCNKAGAVKESEGEKEEEKLMVVEVATPATGNIEVQGEFSGSLEYADEISVFPKLSGEITKANFEEGDFVTEGSLLFSIDDDAYQISVKTAQAAYDVAKTTKDKQVGALQMNRDSAVNQVLTAQEGVEKVQASCDLYSEQYHILESQMQDLYDKKHDLEDDKDSAEKKLKKAKKALSDAKSSGASDADLAALRTNVNTIKSSISTIENTIDTVENSQKQLESSMASMGFNRETNIYSLNQAVRSADLAQESLQYHDAVTAPTTIASADATVKQAEAGVESASLQLSYTQVTAPVSGYIKKKNVEEHDIASPGNAAYVITGDDTVNAVFEVPEATLKMIEPGQKVSIDRNGEIFDARVTELSQTPADSGLFEIKAAVNDPEKKLATGTSVKVSTRTTHVENVLSVPVNCVYYSGGESYVYAVDDGNIVRKIMVTTGLYDKDSIEIKDGLSTDMRVVTTWSSRLRDGLKVEVSGGPVVSVLDKYDYNAVANIDSLKMDNGELTVGAGSYLPQ